MDIIFAMLSQLGIDNRRHDYTPANRLFNRTISVPSHSTPLLIGLHFLMVFTAQAMENKPLRHQALKINPTDEATYRFTRQQWDLTEDEWQRYEQLMLGIRGSISPKTISPIEVLGTHARTDEERNKYARLWAKMMHDDISQTLTFQRAYDEAWRELYPDENIIDLSKLDLKLHQVDSFQDGDRILAFVIIKDCEPCIALIKRVQKQTRSLKVQLDIFFLDTVEHTDDHRIRQWATEQAINKELIQQGHITLNHDKGTLFTMTGQVAVPNNPLLYRIRNQSIESMD